MTDEPESTANLRRQYVQNVGMVTLQILDEGRTPVKAEELAMVAARYADSEIEAWKARPISPKGIACRSGCSSCCHAAVAITIPEAILMGNTVLGESTDDELAEILAKVRQAAEARAGLVGKARDWSIHPCPMLDEEGACSIYEFRPLNCRGWTSLDVSRCEAVFDDPSRGLTIPIDGIQRTIGLSIALGLQGGLEARGLEHSLVDLATALRIILEDPTTIDRWLDGSPAFREAEVAVEVHRD